MEIEYLKLVLGTYLFVKIPRPRDCEGTFSVFESNCHLLQPEYPLIGGGNKSRYGSLEVGGQVAEVGGPGPLAHP